MISMPSKARMALRTGAPRSVRGRTTSLSVSPAMIAIAAMAASMPGSQWNLFQVMAVTAAKPPSMAHSPTAKLMMPVGRRTTR